jgi:hypothetical protein
MTTCTNTFTLYDVMADDHEVYVKKNKKFGVDISIQDIDQNVVMEETVHDYAARAMADFCRQFLHFYDAMEKREELTAVA